MPKVFVSYSREDEDFVFKLARDLRSQGADVWLDQGKISYGKRWDNAVQEALETCEYFIVILSPTAVASENVKDEVAFAK